MNDRNRAKGAVATYLQQCSSLSKLNKVWICTRTPYLTPPDHKAPWCIMSNLYLADGMQAYNPQIISRIQPQIIVNATGELVNIFENGVAVKLLDIAMTNSTMKGVIPAQDADSRIAELKRWVEQWQLPPIKYINLRLRDTEDDNLLLYTRAIASIASREEAVVMVHCNAGISRSVAVICAILMIRYNFTFDQALDMVKKERKIAQPNPGFVRQLRTLESMLKHAVDFETIANHQI
jgi:hypothetical protein